MIDLGIELGGYDDNGEPRNPSEEKTTYTLADVHNMRWAHQKPPRLKDLQAQGFNTTPPPGYVLPPRWLPDPVRPAIDAMRRHQDALKKVQKTMEDLNIWPPTDKFDL